MISFQVERWMDIRPEMENLLPSHWEEIALHKDKVPLDIDHEKYAELDEKESLHIVTARNGDELIGYHVSIVTTHLHYKSTLHGITDVYYLKPEHRKGFTGVRLFQSVEDELKKIGVRKLYTGTKLHMDMGKLFERLGYTETERLFTKYIGD